MTNSGSTGISAYVRGQPNSDEGPLPLLCLVEADRRQWRIAAAVLLVSVAFFVVAAPLAKLQLPEIWAFLPAYQTAYIAVTLITAILLFGQFQMLHSWGLLILAAGYLFNTLMAVVHLLSFSGFLASPGLLGAGPQTTAWLYFLWHGGFSLFVTAFAVLKGSRHDPLPRSLGANQAAIGSAAAVVALVTGMLLLATFGLDFLPAIMQGHADAPGKVLVAVATMTLGGMALVILWLRRPHSLLDLWLMVAMCVWSSDTALAALLNHGRFDLGWYGGRIYGLLAAGFVLVMLLRSSNSLFRDLLRLRTEEYRRTLRELQASDARFSATFEQAAVGIGLVAPDGHWLEANRRLCEIVGYSEPEMRSLKYQDITHPEDLAADLDHVRQLLDGRVQTFTRETRYLHKNGQIVWINLAASLVRAPDGSPGYFVGVVEDITERMRAQSALAEREAQYRAVIETTADGFWMVDERGRILAANEVYAWRSGYSIEELQSMSIADLEAQESPEEVRRHVAKVRSEGSGLFETWHRAKSGERWPVEVTTTYWAEAGGRFFCFLRDITERKRAAAALKAFEEETKSLTQFEVARQTAAAIAHELNQPLNAVAMYAEAALRLLRGGNPRPDKLQYALEGSAQQAQRAGQVVRELLTFMNENEVATEPLQLNDIIRNVLKRVEADGFTGVDFRLDLDLALPAVQVNRIQLEKVLINLIENGIEAMRDAAGGTRSIKIRAQTGADAGMAQVTVVDSGPGIDAPTLHRIFEPFFTTKPRGLGMGLAISRAIIEALGGRLWAESTPGAGARFHLTLPFTP